MQGPRSLAYIGNDSDSRDYNDSDHDDNNGINHDDDGDGNGGKA